MSVHRWSLTQNESPFLMRLPFRKEEQEQGEEGIENENYNRGGGECIFNRAVHQRLVFVENIIVVCVG